jgi:hypothetical protein
MGDHHPKNFDVPLRRHVFVGKASCICNDEFNSLIGAKGPGKSIILGDRSNHGASSFLLRQPDLEPGALPAVLRSSKSDLSD